MYALTSGGGCLFPIQPSACYANAWMEEGEIVPSLELIDKKKNVFGDMIYYIRDQRGVTSQVYEGDLLEFMKSKGVSELKEGSPLFYSRKSK